MEKDPQYFCPMSADIYLECTREDLYDDPDLPYVVNWDSPYSIVNWAERRDLTRSFIVILRYKSNDNRTDRHNVLLGLVGGQLGNCAHL